VPLRRTGSGSFPTWRRAPSGSDRSKEPRPGFEQGLSRPFPNRGEGRCKPRTGSPTRHPQQKNRYGALEVARSTRAWADGPVQGRAGERKGGARPLEKATITGIDLAKRVFQGHGATQDRDHQSLSSSLPFAPGKRKGRSRGDRPFQSLARICRGQ